MLLPFDELDHPLIIAHRGSAVLAPENTLYAFDLALSTGADVLEMDVHPSADGEVMVIHDPTVDRTSNGKGSVGAMTRKELQKLDFAWQFSIEGTEGYPLRGQGISIPTLAEVLKRYRSTPMSIDIKHDDPNFATEVVKVVLKADARERVVLGSFHPRIARLLGGAVPRLHTAADRRQSIRLLRKSLLRRRMRGADLPSAYMLPARLGRFMIASRTLVRTIHEAGRRGYFWTIDDEPTMVRLLVRGVDGIVTNRPDLLFSLRRAWTSGEEAAPF